MGEPVKLWRQFFKRPDGSTGIRYSTAEPPEELRGDFPAVEDDPFPINDSPLGSMK